MAKHFNFLDNEDAIKLRTAAEKYCGNNPDYRRLSLVRYNLIETMKVAAGKEVAAAYDAINQQLWDEYERAQEWAMGDIARLMRQKCPRYIKNGHMVCEDLPDDYDVDADAAKKPAIKLGNVEG